MTGSPWWVDAILLILALCLLIKVAGLARENRKLKDIVRHLEGETAKPNEEPKEMGQGGAEGES